MVDKKKSDEAKTPESTPVAPEPQKQPEATPEQPKTESKSKSKTDPRLDGNTVFVVTVDALNITTGRDKQSGRPEVARLLHGQLLAADPESTIIKQFLHTKSIKKFVEGRDAPRATARLVTEAYGSPEDPVLPPNTDVQPTKA